jgi:hypothetical protein
MAAGLLEPLVVFWKSWGILVLVLLSFTLQVILLVTAEIRRRKDSGVLKVVVWLAYLLADTTAIYALGHMSVISPTGEEHQLMAFWAPFLLLHLGGQDNTVFYISFWEKISPLVEIHKIREINEISKKEFKNFDQI